MWSFVLSFMPFTSGASALSVFFSFARAFGASSFSSSADDVFCDSSILKKLTAALKFSAKELSCTELFVSSSLDDVCQKVVADAPHEVLLVLDASTGQNAIEQARQFMAATEVNALALTKLDGTAKGGVVIGISDQFKIPVKYIGVGEGIDHLQIFDRNDFVNSLFEGRN